jgi:hypothetical protein
VVAAAAAVAAAATVAVAMLLLRGECYYRRSAVLEPGPMYCWL